MNINLQRSLISSLRNEPITKGSIRYIHSVTNSLVGIHKQEASVQGLILRIDVKR